MINQVVEQNIYTEFRDFLYMDKQFFVLNISYYKYSWDVSKVKKLSYENIHEINYL